MQSSLGYDIFCLSLQDTGTVDIMDRIGKPDLRLLLEVQKALLISTRLVEGNSSMETSSPPTSLSHGTLMVVSQTLA